MTYTQEANEVDDEGIHNGEAEVNTTGFHANDSDFERDDCEGEEEDDEDDQDMMEED